MLAGIFDLLIELRVIDILLLFTVAPVLDRRDIDKLDDGRCSLATTQRPRHENSTSIKGECRSCLMNGSGKGFCWNNTPCKGSSFN